MVTSEQVKSDGIKPLKDALVSGTVLLDLFVRGELTVADFCGRYGNFFYENALTGDESTPEQTGFLREHSALCKLHEQVQELLYSVYESDEPVPEYEAAGKIRSVVAATKIKGLAEEAMLPKLLEGLRSLDGGE